LLQDGDKIDTLFFEEGFELSGDKGRVLAEFASGQPAIVLAEHGKGRAMIVGSFVGSAYHHFQNPNNGKFLAGLADWLGIVRRWKSPFPRVTYWWRRGSLRGRPDDPFCL